MRQRKTTTQPNNRDPSQYIQKANSRWPFITALGFNSGHASSITSKIQTPKASIIRIKN